MTAEPGARPGRIPLGLMLALGFTSMAGSLSTDLYLPAFPWIVREFEVPASVVQLTLTAFMVGIACGQLVIGSLSDALGRRRTLLVGLSVFALGGVAAALSPTIEALIAVRAVQGVGGAAGVVLARAIIADLLPPREAARAYGLLFMMIGTGPAVASPLGAVLAGLGGWRAALAGLAVVATAMLLVSALRVPESLPASARHPFRLGVLAGNVGRLLAEPAFVGYAIAMGSGYAAMVVYIGSSSFIAQEVFGLSPIGYAATFACGSLSFMLAAWASGRLAPRWGAARVLRAGQAVQLAAGGAALALVLAGTLPLPVWLVLAWLVSAGAGLVMPTASGLGLARAVGVAGSGSALIGFGQFFFGAFGSPIGGLFGDHTVVPAAAGMACFAAISLAAGLLARWAVRREGSGSPAD